MELIILSLGGSLAALLLARRITRNGHRYASPWVLAFAAAATQMLAVSPGEARETCPPDFDQMWAIMKVQSDLFAALENEDQAAWERSTVRDFVAFEGGHRYGRTAFFEEIKHAHATGHHFSWSVTNPHVELDCSVATLIYVNQGYVIDGSAWAPASWLETATFRYAAGQWRTVFVESMRQNSAGESTAPSVRK